MVYIAPNSFKIQKTLLKYAKLTKAIIALGFHEFDLKNMESPKKSLDLINYVDLLFLNDFETKLITEASSFLEEKAGAFSAKYLSCRNVIKACKYGCLISSLIVGDFGLNALLNLTQNKIKELIKEFIV